MKAMIVPKPGPDATLEQQEVPDPVAGFNDVVVRVEAAGVNNADMMVRMGYFGPEARIPGHDVSGTVADIGGAFPICLSAPGSS
jgi:NADPH2:quinone reductase